MTMCTQKPAVSSCSLIGYDAPSGRHSGEAAQLHVGADRWLAFARRTRSTCALCFQDGSGHRYEKRRLNADAQDHIWQLCLWGVSVGVARLLGGSSALSTWTATIVFSAIWFVVAAANMWVGVSQAGYSFCEKLPIFLLIFLLPVDVAVFVKWKVL
jgi:hypothetical protein